MTKTDSIKRFLQRVGGGAIPIASTHREYHFRAAGANDTSCSALPQAERNFGAY